jgi:hypothetical protein
MIVRQWMWIRCWEVAQTHTTEKVHDVIVLEVWLQMCKTTKSTFSGVERWLCIYYTVVSGEEICTSVTEWSFLYVSAAALPLFMLICKQNICFGCSIYSVRMWEGCPGAQILCVWLCGEIDTNSGCMSSFWMVSKCTLNAAVMMESVVRCGPRVAICWPYPSGIVGWATSEY